MMRLLYRRERCKGCLLCIDACNKNALSAGGPNNKMGYETIVIDAQSCVLCGSCYLVCPDGCFEIREDAP